MAELIEHNDICQVLAAINSLKGHADSTEDNNPDTGPSVDDQAIQDLVTKMLSALSPAEKLGLDEMRRLLDSGNYKCDTLKVDDTLSERRIFRVRNRVEIIGLYPFATKQSNTPPNLRLIDEVAWYSAGFNGATGNLKGGKNWLTAAAIDSAAARHCRLSLCVQSRDSRNIDSLLRDPSAQHELILEILETLDDRHAAGVNLLFDAMPPNSAPALTAFIRQLAAALKGRGAHSYRFGVRIPAYATEDKYDLPALNQYVDRFWVDFTEYRRNDPAPLAPLAGISNNDLGTCISRYVNMSLPASKLLICIPYFGVRWTWRSGKWVAARSISYKEIRSHAYRQLPAYDPLADAAELDITTGSGALTDRLWYDDEVSLAAKFEFIRQNNLGGIVIDSLGDDDGYGDLWDVKTSGTVYDRHHHNRAEDKRCKTAAPSTTGNGH